MRHAVVFPPGPRQKLPSHTETFSSHVIQLGHSFTSARCRFNSVQPHLHPNPTLSPPHISLSRASLRRTRTPSTEVPKGVPGGPPHPSLRLARPKRHATLSSKGSHTGPYAVETGAIPWRDCPLMVGCRVNRTAIQRHGCLSCQCSQGQCSCTQQQDQEVCAEPHWTAGYCHPSL